MEKITTVEKFDDNFTWVDDSIKTVLNLAYHFGITPFHINLQLQENRYSFVSNKWGKYFTVVLSAISAICACISANSALSRADLSSPSIIFKIAPDVGDTFLCFSFWYVIWTRQREISTYFSLLSLHTHNKWRLVEFGNGNGEHQGKNHTNWRSRKFPLTSVIILMVLLIVGFDMLKTCSRLRSRSPSVEFYRSLMGANFQDLRNGLMLDNRSDKVLEEMELYEIIISSVYMIFTIYCKLVKAFALLLCLAGVLVVYSNSCDFKEYLLKEIDQLKVMHAFQAFQDFIESVNQVTGPIVFSIAIVCAPTFFVANLGSLLIVWNLDSPITWLTYIIYIVIFLPAAEVTNQTDEFREWILECGAGQHENDFFAIFVDLTQNPLGIKGTDCFTLTYTFMAQMFSAVVSFTIILLQFQ